MDGYTYDLMPWGDLIRGTRAALESLGLVFPLDAGRRRQWECVDPRGFPCTISRGEVDAFTAQIQLPGREEKDFTTWQHANGVKSRTLWWADLFEGKGAALVAAGLVTAGELPGAPGRMKTVAHYDPTGTPLPIKWSSYTDDMPGARSIRRIGSDRYRVYVAVSAAERERRNQAALEAKAAYLAHVTSLPRPAPLVAQDREAQARKRRSQMSLAWSRPRWEPTIVAP